MVRTAAAIRVRRRAQKPARATTAAAAIRVRRRAQKPARAPTGHRRKLSRPNAAASRTGVNGENGGSHTSAPASTEASTGSDGSMTQALEAKRQYEPNVLQKTINDRSKTPKPDTHMKYIYSRSINLKIYIYS
jgi:hypothetical protein